MTPNIHTIQHTYDLPTGTMTMTLVADVSEAERRANGQTAYLYQSKIIKALYLFIPLVEKG